jgi:hypothetical protein
VLSIRGGVHGDIQADDCSEKSKESGSFIRYIRWMDENGTYYLGKNFSRRVILNNLAYIRCVLSSPSAL